MQPLLLVVVLVQAPWLGLVLLLLLLVMVLVQAPWLVLLLLLLLLLVVVLAQAPWPVLLLLLLQPVLGWDVLLCLVQKVLLLLRLVPALR
jgi:hypothetical protein